MFFHLQLEREIELQPRFFGPRLAEVLHQKLRTEVSCCTILSLWVFIDGHALHPNIT